MAHYQSVYVDMCYTNYDGLNYTSTKVIDEYLLYYDGPNCVGANVTSVDYLSTTCQVDGITAVLVTYNDNPASSGSHGLSQSSSLAIGIVLSFVGGVGLALVAVYVWVHFIRKAPMSQQSDKTGVQL